MSENAKNTQERGLAVLDNARENFSVAMKDAQRLDIVNNVCGAFDAAIIVQKLEAILTDEIMDAVFMPLMNKKIGFRTDRDPSRPDKRTGVAPKPYTRDVVRTCIIDAAANGLLPTGNQFNIISSTMYPTKEGYTALLAKLKASPMQLVYTFEFDPETKAVSADPTYVAIPCRVGYKTSREDMKGWFRYVAMVKSNGETSTTDQLRGKAERKCKKAFFEFLTGIDLGDADANEVIDVPYTEVSSTTSAPAGAAPAPERKSAAQRAREIMAKAAAKKEAEAAAGQQQAAQQPAAETPQAPAGQQTVDFDKMSDEEIEAFVKSQEGGE